MTLSYRIKSKLLSRRRFTTKSRVKILFIIGILVCILCIYYATDGLHILNNFRKTSKTIYYIQTNSFTLNTTDSIRHIYEQQLFQYNNAPFLPTYQNYRLILKFNVKSIATQLYSNANSFQGSNRRLQVTCLKKYANETNFQQSFDILLYFHVKPVNSQAIQFTFDSITVMKSPAIISTEPAKTQADLVMKIFVRINQVFSVDSVFSFTYQWLDLDVLNSLEWPRWPLTKSCAEDILKDQNHSSCANNHILTYVTPRQLFDNERMAMADWLDAFYNETNLPTSTTHSRRLSPVETASNRNVCTVEFNNWILNYQNWHNDIMLNLSDPRLTFEEQRDRIIQQNIRFLVYKRNSSGVADRIIHLMTTYLIAILTKRLLLFENDWPELPFIMLASLNYDYRLVIPWLHRINRLNRHLSRTDPKYISSRYSRFSFDRFRNDYDYDQQFSERILIFRAHTGGIVHMMSSPTSVYRKFLTEDLRMRVENMFGCLYHSLLIYRLPSLIEITSTVQHDRLGHSPQQLLQVLLSPKFYPIGVQMRIGDDAMGINKDFNLFRFFQNKKTSLESFQYFLSCAQDLVSQNQTFPTDIEQMPVIFLLSDTVNLRREALLRWKLSESCLQSPKYECQNATHALPVVANSNPVFHIAYTSQQLLAFHLAIFDIFLFSFCEQHVITYESGFGNLGVFMSLKQRNIYSLSVEKDESCFNNSNTYISLKESGYKWSGI